MPSHGIAGLRTTSRAIFGGRLDLDDAGLIWTLAPSLPRETGPSVGSFWTVSDDYGQLLAERASASTPLASITYDTDAMISTTTVSAESAENKAA